jgi:hypothetical protein
MIDAAHSADGVITIPADGIYEITGEVVVVAPPAATITITGSGGQAKLLQTEETSCIFILGSEDETAVAGNIVMKDLWIQYSFSQQDPTANSEVAGPVFVLGTREA